MQVMIMMFKLGAIKGAVVGIMANAIANYVSFGELQPANIVVGLVVGAVLGYMFLN